MITQNNTVLHITAGRTDEPMTATAFAEREISTLTFNVLDKDGACVFRGVGRAEGKVAALEAQISATAWSAETPYLYTLECSIIYADGTEEKLSDRFGYRYFSTDSKYIYLNGYPFYMRAYIRGAAAHEHGNNSGLSEYEFYKKNFVMAKKYGYNTVRFHSVIPTDECFRAADEIGMLVHIEMRAENLEYDNLQEMLYGKNDFVSDAELVAIINRLYNHPSFMVYCVGNEIRQPGKKPRIREIRDLIKRLDPTRLFIDTCAHGEFDRDYVDFDVQHMGYFFPYGKNRDMFSDTDNLLGFGTVRERDMVSEGEGSVIRRGIAFSRPLIAHEVCHYTSWRDFYALREKFIRYGKEAPWWIDEEIKLLEAKGYKDNFAETLQITKNFQMRAWKCALESIRASHLLSGFHMLQFADTDKYENSNGVVDCFDDPHGISPEQFRRFNADTVVLARLPKQIFTYGETVKVPVLLSQFMIAPPKRGEFSYTLKKGTEQLRSGRLTDVDTGESGTYEICSLEIRLPRLCSADKLTLTCRLDLSDGTAVENSWELWLFPPVEREERIDAALDMRESYLDRFVTNPSSPLTVTDKLDDGLFDRLDRGEDVILIYRTDWCRHLLNKGMAAPRYSFVHTWDRFKGVIWDRGTINGGRDDKSALTSLGFPTDGEISFQYYHLIDDSDKINLDNLPVRVHSLVSGIDKCNRDRFDVTKFKYPDPRPERCMRNFSYAFELRVGRGRLFVTGFNLTGCERGEPATVAMLKALVAYCHSEGFGRGEHISTADLRAYLAATAAEGPQKEGMMTQYWQLDDEPVESMEYWTESERYLRED